MRAVKSVSIDSARRVIITYLDGSTETLYPNCIWCDSEALRELIKDLLEEKADAITQTIKNVTVATFSDGADEGMIKNLLVSIEPVQDLHGYDHPWPAGGGKNKIGITNWKEALTSNGITFTPVFDTAGNLLYITGTGTSTERAQYTNNITVLPSAGTYTLSQTTPISNSCTSFINYVEEGTSKYLDVGKIIGQTSATTTIGELTSAMYTVEVRDAGVTINDFRWYPQLELGSTATSWTPYSNICPISGFEGLTVTRTAINVWDEEWENGTFNTTTGVNINTTSTNRQIRSKNARIPVKGGESYYFKWFNSSAIGGLWTMFFDADENIITDFVPSGDYVDKSGNCCLFRNRVVEVPENAAFCKFYCTFDYGDTYNHDISINYPATDTEYHAYKGSTYSVNWETEAGTVYGGSLDVVSGVLVIDRGVGVFDGSSDENWMKYNMGSASAFAMKITVAGMKKAHAESAIVISNELTSLTPGAVWGSNESFISTQSDSEFLVAGINTITVVDNWRAYLASSPLQVVYELDTPTEIQLTPQEVTTLLGTNNIWADSGKILELEYAADTKLYIGEQQSASSGTLGMANRPTVVDKQFEPVAEITYTDSEVTE